MKILYLDINFRAVNGMVVDVDPEYGIKSFRLVHCIRGSDFQAILGVH